MSVCVFPSRYGGRRTRTYKGDDEPSGQVDPDSVCEHSFFGVCFLDGELGDYATEQNWNRDQRSKPHSGW